ncbi:MAG: hypothetical protein Q9194_005576 [Teloschistes cf. exilis]
MTSVVEFAASGDYTNVHRQTNTNEHPRRASTPAEVMSEERRGPSGSERADNADGKESDDAEADDADGNVGEPDVIAPSDNNLDIGQDQTGLHRTSNHAEAMPDEKNRGEGLGLLDTESPSQSCNAINESPLSKEEPVSDDEDYNGVDLISESGDEHPMMESIEEKAIIESEEAHLNLSRLLSPPNSSSDAFPFYFEGLQDTDYDTNPFFTDDPFFHNELDVFDPDHCGRDIDFHKFTNTDRLGSPFAATTRRRVRFADSPMVSLEADAQDSSNVGPVKTPQTQPCGHSCDDDRPVLAGAGQSAAIAEDTITHGSRQYNKSSLGEEKFLEYEDDEGSVGNSSGYETLLRDSSTSTLNNHLARHPLPKPPPRRFRQGTKWSPTMGSWVTNPTKPIAVVATSGKRLIVYPAQRPESRGDKIFPTIASAPASPRPTPAKLAALAHHTATEESEVERSGKSSQETATPMLSASPDLVMSGLGLGRANLVSGHTLGTPEVFFPFGSAGADDDVMDDELDIDDDDEEDAGEGLLNIEDFINFSDDSEDSEHDGEHTAKETRSHSVAVPETQQPKASLTSPSPSPTAPTHNLLDHLDRGVVTAFRRNQYGRGAGGFLPSSASSFHAATAMKKNAFVASNAASVSNKKRKLGSSYAPPAIPKNALAKRRVLNR